MRLKGKNVVILVAQEFEDIELLYPLVRLSEEGAMITVATLPKDAYAHFHTRPYFPEKPMTGRFGSTVPLVVLEEGKRWVHNTIDKIKAKDFDAMMVPGGFCPDYLRIDDDTLSFVADMYKTGKVVAAICHGPQVLISTDKVKGTDMVKGKRVCSYIAVRDDLQNAGGLWEDTPAVTVDNVVTGRCPDDLPDFIAHIIEAMTK